MHHNTLIQGLNKSMLALKQAEGSQVYNHEHVACSNLAATWVCSGAVGCAVLDRWQWENTCETQRSHGAVHDTHWTLVYRLPRAPCVRTCDKLAVHFYITGNSSWFCVRTSCTGFQIYQVCNTHLVCTSPHEATNKTSTHNCAQGLSCPFWKHRRTSSLFYGVHFLTRGLGSNQSWRGIL